MNKNIFCIKIICDISISQFISESKHMCNSQIEDILILFLIFQYFLRVISLVIKPMITIK